MGRYQKVYTDEQREAVEQAWSERGIRPASRIQRLAGDGELTCNGDLVAAFAIPEASIRTIGSRHARQLEGRVQSDLLKLPASDSIEELRRRLVSATDAQLRHIEALQRRRQFDKVNGEQLRQIGRAIREIASLPSTNGQPAKTVKPGAHDPARGGKTSGATRGGLAGKIMASVNAPHPITAAADDALPTENDQSPTRHTSDHLDETTEPETHDNHDNQTDKNHDDPGLYVREQIAALGR
jgi:hypothetical protein